MELMTREYNKGRFNSFNQKDHIYFRDSLPKDKEPLSQLILIHGAVEHMGRHHRLLKFLESQFQDSIITQMDLKGHGLSGGGRSHIESFEEFSSDVVALINREMPWDKHIQKRIVLGHSLGGLVVLDTFLNHADKVEKSIDGLILSNPCIKPALDVPQGSETLLKASSRFLSKIRLPSLYKGEDLTNDLDLAEDFDLDPLIPKFMTIGLMNEIMEKTKEIRAKSYFLNYPCLFLFSGQDKLVDNDIGELFARGMAQEYKSVVNFPSAKHELFNEVSDIREQSFKEIKHWLKSQGIV